MQKFQNPPIAIAFIHDPTNLKLNSLSPPVVLFRCEQPNPPLLIITRTEDQICHPSQLTNQNPFLHHLNLFQFQLVSKLSDNIDNYIIMTTNPDTSIEESLQSNKFQTQPLEITISNSYAENERILTPLSDFSEEFSLKQLFILLKNKMPLKNKLCIYFKIIFY